MFSYFFRSNWPGEYSFKVSFENQEKNNISKHINWTYSETSNKLYVMKDASCPVNFSTNRAMHHGCTVRVMAVYSAPEHFAQPVTRCLNHSRSELEKDVFEAEHLIRSESSFASYQTDSGSGRHSVIVPFENPPECITKQGYYTTDEWPDLGLNSQQPPPTKTFGHKHVDPNRLKAVSYDSSCAGGPNRRLLTLIFTLELGDIVLGRQSLELKICANPRRDREIAEKRKPEPSASKFKPPEEIII
ncbi:UNVERIFIED_CONTAM: tp53 [Trichonephila clavipes]